MLSTLAIALALLGAARATLIKPATPPRGWNSYDAFGASNESVTIANAAVLANSAAFKDSGYVWVTIDAGWFAAGNGKNYSYAAKRIDAYGRPIGSLEKYPSAAPDGSMAGVAAQVHALGLKFGLWYMGGLPHEAVDQNTPIKGTNYTARDLYQNVTYCPRWDKGWGYEVNHDHPAAQAWFDSLVELWSSWDIDFIKLDCANAEDETRPHRLDIMRVSDAMARDARGFVLSLSPGGFSNISQINDIRPFVSMGRATDDFWDVWGLYMNSGGGGGAKSGASHWDAARDLVAGVRNTAPDQYWIDMDMLPFGRIGHTPWCTKPFTGHGPGCARQTRYTADEEMSILTLWALVQSPLILGSDLTTLDAGTATRVTNPRVLAFTEDIGDAWEALRRNASGGMAAGYLAWRASSKRGAGAGAAGYAAVFNLADAAATVKVRWRDLGLLGGPGGSVVDLWTGEVWTPPPDGDEFLTASLPAHGVLLVSLGLSDVVGVGVGAGVDAGASPPPPVLNSADVACSLNGAVGANGACACFQGWKNGANASCELLSIAPMAAPTRDAWTAAYGMHPNVSSWGGNIIVDNDAGLAHLFVSEIAGGCNLHEWVSHSTIVHATALWPVPAGEDVVFAKRDLALPMEAHNASPLKHGDYWYIFHIGSADANPPPKPCTSPGGGDPAPPQRPAATAADDAPAQCALTTQLSHAACTEGVSFGCYPGNHSMWASRGCRGVFSCDGAAGVACASDDDGVAQCACVSGPASSSFLHRASSPDGPWEPMPSFGGCNNAAPLVHPNGTFFVGCIGDGSHLIVWSTNDPANEPWQHVWTIDYPAFYAGGPYLRTEDPFLWIDKRGAWHLLTHSYDYRDGWPPNPNETQPVPLVSRHAFSATGGGAPGAWHFSEHAPYPPHVTFGDGSVQKFATWERPHLLMGADGEPSHLINGVSPVWLGPDGNPCSQCDRRAGSAHSCVVCKTSCSAGYCVDWTYTVVSTLE